MDKFFDWTFKWLMNLPKELAKEQNKAVRVLAEIATIPYCIITIPFWLPTVAVCFLLYGVKGWYDNI